MPTQDSGDGRARAHLAQHDADDRQLGGSHGLEDADLAGALEDRRVHGLEDDQEADDDGDGDDDIERDVESRESCRVS